jgi:hypothetical protein
MLFGIAPHRPSELARRQHKPIGCIVEWRFTHRHRCRGGAMLKSIAPYILARFPLPARASRNWNRCRSIPLCLLPARYMPYPRCSGNGRFVPIPAFNPSGRWPKQPTGRAIRGSAAITHPATPAPLRPSMSPSYPAP